MSFERIKQYLFTLLRFTYCLLHLLIKFAIFALVHEIIQKCSNLFVSEIAAGLDFEDDIYSGFFFCWENLEIYSSSNSILDLM